MTANASTAQAQKGGGVTALGLWDCLRLFWNVIFPVWAQGILLKRPRILRWASRGDWDSRAVRFLQSLRRRYGEGPLTIQTPWRRYALMLSYADARRVLDETPEPFTPATQEKQAALSHFEPHNSLITRGSMRTGRRELHDSVLESNQKRHHLAEKLLSQSRDEVGRLLAAVGRRELTWPVWTYHWYAGVRRLIFGDAAWRAVELTDLLFRLRARSNWVFFHALDSGLRERYQARLQEHLCQAAPDSLAGIARARASSPGLELGDQVTQWLFAFDAGGITIFRALALATAFRLGCPDEDHVRALFLDTLRLWPTTPAILREATGTISWQGRGLPGGTGFLIFAPFFHRDDERLANANRLDFTAWLNKDPAGVPPFLSFSSGPAVCPGRQLITMIATEWLVLLLKQRFQLMAPRGVDKDWLPGTLDYFSIRLRRLV